MANKKGRLRNPDGGIVNSDDYAPRLAMPGARDIIEVKEESWGRIIFGWTKGLVAFVLVAVTILALLYSGLAATLMVLTPVSDNATERSWVVRNTWRDTGGKPPLSEEVVISSTSVVPEAWWELVMTGWTGIKSPAIVKISSTDYDKLYIANSKVTNLANNKSSNFVGSPAFGYDPTDATEQNVQLKNQYLVECVSGNCEKGTSFIITSTQIFGERQE